ncbi:putative metal chaperone YciC [compost metagenome]
MRAKGLVWIPVKYDLAATISQAGPSIQFGPAGPWVASLPERERQAVLDFEPEVQKKWDSRYGDRINEIVMIGIDMDRLELERQLDHCLLTEEEMDSDWSLFHNPLPWISDEAYEANLLM